MLLDIRSPRGATSRPPSPLFPPDCFASPARFAPSSSNRPPDPFSSYLLLPLPFLPPPPSTALQ
eukprot:68549-Chlamydomonas_euryale.AAC.1